MFEVLQPAISIFENYGWYLLICFIIMVVILNKVSGLFKPLYDKYKREKFEREYSAKYHKNPDLFAAYQTNQDKRVQQLQEQYNQAAEEHKTKLKEKQEIKNMKSVYDLGHTLGKNESDDKNTGFKSNYNPLMGAGSSSNYRPPKRSPCGGGGCGR